MLYRQSKCELAKVNCCNHLDHQLPWSLWLGLQASLSDQTWRRQFHRILSCSGASIQCSTGKVSVNWPKWTALTTWTTSCLGRSGSACRQAEASKLGIRMVRASGEVLPLSVSSYLVVFWSVTPMLYRQSKCELAKVNCCNHLDHQLPWSLWLGLQASWSHQTWHANVQDIGLGAAVVRFIVSCRGPARHINSLPAK